MYGRVQEHAYGEGGVTGKTSWLPTISVRFREANQQSDYGEEGVSGEKIASKDWLCMAG